MDKKKLQLLIKQSNNAWKKLSEWWDMDIEDGDPFHCHLVFPGVLELLNIKANDEVLDIACGNGALSRKMSMLGALVTANDVSETFISQARKRSDKSIDYQVLDATSFAELTALGDAKQFDKVVCSMALHDLPTIAPLAQSLLRLMKKGGCFVFSVPHPCFNMGELELDFFSNKPHISRSRYSVPEHLEMKSKRDQPVNQHCFHRSISDLFMEFFRVGMVLDAIREPSLSELNCDLDAIDLDWKFLSEIPPVLICRWVFK